jgi:ATP adenylyltransferase
MSSLSWDEKIAGKGCTLCGPLPEQGEYSFKVADLGISTLLLQREQIYRGYCILAFTGRHATGLERLTAEEHSLFMADLRKAGNAVFAAVVPDHMNYATLGNAVPHLHVHIIPRYRTDPRWGGTVWEIQPDETKTPSLTDAEYGDLVRLIRGKLAA